MTRMVELARGAEATAPALPRRQARERWAVVALGTILLFNLLFTPHFFTLQLKSGHVFGSLVDVVHRAAPIALMAIGMTFAIATKGIDISVGSVAAVAGALAAAMIVRHQPLGVVIAVPLLVAAGIGAWNGLLVTAGGIQPIIATLVMMVAGRGIAQLITDGQILVYEYPPFEFVANGFFLGLPFSFTILAAVAALVWLAARRTAAGLFVEAVGVNRSAARLAGVNVALVTFLVYVLSGLCAGISGLIFASEIKGADANTAGLNYELDAILAVVIGGTSMEGGRFTLLGSVLGALVIQSLNTTILTRGVAVQATLVVKALVVFAICLLQSDNLRRVAGGLLAGRRAP
jgi:simple sugar transport system permease protein